jgi:poly(hydroxyalkanoate) granule-associated protein
MEPNQAPKSDAAEDQGQGAPKTDPADPVFEALRDIWHVGLGIAVLAGEQGARLIKTAAEKGRSAEPNLREPVRKAGESVSDAASEVGARLKEIGESIGRRAGKLENLVDQRISKTVSELATPIQEELKSLNQKVEELRDKLDELRRHRSASPPDDPGRAV